jgi:hypothetical protein
MRILARALGLPDRRPIVGAAIFGAAMVFDAIVGASARSEDREATLQKTFASRTLPLLTKYCGDCHGPKLSEGDIRLDSLSDWQKVRSSNRVLQNVLEQLRSAQMPPRESEQPTETERKAIESWISDWLMHQAERFAGDPGPVILRRLNNAEYTYTLRDLTGIRDLDPAREFPADSAAGEGFSNSGAALVMSPALVRKYLDAAKQVAEHAVLLPDRIAFATNPSVSDLTNDRLDQIRRFYAQFTDQSGGETVNLQGIVFETNQGGRLPIEKYLKGTLQIRDTLAKAPQDNSSSLAASSPAVKALIESLAADSQLSPKYLGLLWDVMATDKTSSGDSDGQSRSLLDHLRESWRRATVAEHDALVAEILGWQRSLFRFTSVGHIGKVNGPKAWQEAVDPVRAEHELRFPLPSSSDNQDITVYLQVTDAGDGSEGDVAVLENPRLVAPGRPDLPLRHLDSVAKTIQQQQARWITSTSEALDTLDAWLEGPRTQTLSQVAESNRLDPQLLQAWAKYLGISESPPEASSSQRIRFKNKIEKLSGYEFINGWGAEDALSVIANASDQQVRIPGNMPPKSVSVHPSPSRAVCVAFRAPEKLLGQCTAMVRHAHTECGNGVAWRLELRRGGLKQVLANGFSAGATAVPIGPFESLWIRENDEVVLVVEPRDGNHSCDLTNIELEINSNVGRWSLSRDITPDVLAGNPHADSAGHAGVWDFFSEAVASTDATFATVPPQSLLGKWFNEPNAEERRKFAGQLEQLLLQKGQDLPGDAPDAILIRQLQSSTGPFLIAALASASTGTNVATSVDSEHRFGLDSKFFGTALGGESVAASDAVFQAPGVIPIRIPAALAAGAQLVTKGRLHPTAGANGSVQFAIQSEPPLGPDARIPQTTVLNKDANWTTPSRQVLVASPIVLNPQSDAHRRIEASFAEFRHWFPIALCYPKIVPVDEVVTLTLFYREDEPLRRLLLNEEQTVSLEQLWSELHFVSRDALKLVDAYEQLWQYATQDADPSAFEPLREPIQQRAREFRQSLLDAQPYHLESVLQFANRAYRRPLNEAQSNTIRQLYARLRKSDLPHEEAIRFLVARILVSPEFLYRLESPGPTDKAQPVSDLELANRLSYFLWSSSPDEELMQVALQGTLHNDEVLASQVRRMLRDPRTERMAVEFGCMWLHIRDLDQLNEKSEQHFPEFTDLRGDLYREAILFLSDMIQNDGSVLGLLTADHTFLNEPLAAFYGIPDVTGPQWRKVAGVRQHRRGGILTMGAILSKQAGASRTSPILRGNWLCEVVLGEKLPKPPKNVPVLSEVPPEGVTERQLIELHSSDASCSHCHQRIDPYGFALEAYDAIGRFRTLDASGQKINTDSHLPDGTHIAGPEDLREYVPKERSAEFVKQFNRKLLGFALGRSVQLSDEPILGAIYQQQQKNDYNLSETIVSIVLSPPFRQIRGREFVDEESGAE